MNHPPLSVYSPILRRALEEDLGLAGDLTTQAVVPAGTLAEGLIVARAPGRLAGIDIAADVFRLVDDTLKVTVGVEDGSDAGAGAVLARVSGSARSILTAERTALNLLGRLCGIATMTARIVALVSGTKARVADTRKTTPGLRALEKYAVRCGGGTNHRFGLYDAVLIKDNHLAVAGSITEAVLRARRSVGHTVAVEVEVDTLEQLEEALAAGAHMVLLDNMTPEQLRRAVEAVAGRAVIEASGGITEATAAEIAATGVDLLSIGALTHSAPALDVALDFSTT